jgi:retinoblastoma-like protein 1
MPRDDVLTAVHDVVSHALYQHTSLFYGRHLDQILLAALYGYCKVNRLPQVSYLLSINILYHYLLL